MGNPTRLHEADDAPAELRGWLERAHADAPSQAIVDPLLRAVQRRLESSPPAPLRDGPRFRLGHGTTKIYLAVAAVGLGLGAGVWHLGKGSHDEAPSATQLVVPQSLPTHEPQGPVVDPIREPREPPQPAASIARPEQEVARPAGRPAHITKPSLRPQAAARSTENQGRASLETSKLPSPSPPTNAEEYRLLRAARQAVAEEPARALELADAHLRRFPAGMLVQEREAIAVEALVRLGQDGAAHRRAQAFRAAYPESPYRSRIENALAGGARAPK